ncbi:FHA domain-containing protein PS1-like isoform X1 [Canna indica]|uniref:FHA domain-containing protein PS1-like isoform X1 n=1 Tax=Canna indica TaxID=4628 RepID=A0AAQ3QIZ5_9LILI|nr:FHA domain-containing protein PS1-like isoform X1 [Canna indica]
MANEEKLRSEEEENKIAVLSVLKKGSILKRIFLNCPPPPPAMTTIGSNEELRKQLTRGGAGDCSILFGRHPDCQVVLDHPSISRFHLTARLIPSQQKLSVTDLSSVHGTWVSGTKIPPSSAVDMVDGDTLRLGASTRVYRLQWVSWSRALEMENPLEPVVEDKEEALQKEEEHLSSERAERRSAPFSLLSRINTPSLPQMMNSPLPPKRAPQSPTREAPEVESSRSIWAAPTVELVESSMPTAVDSSPQFLSSVKRCSEQEHLSPERSERRNAPSSLLSRRSKSKSIGFLRIDTGKGKENVGNARPDTETDEGLEKEKNYVGEQAKRDEKLCRVLFADVSGEDQVRDEYFDSDKENVTPMSGRQKIKRSSGALLKSVCVAKYFNFEVNALCVSNKEPKNSTSESLTKSSMGKATLGSDQEIFKSSISAAKESHKETPVSKSSNVAASSVLEDVLHIDKENFTKVEDNVAASTMLDDLYIDKENWRPDSLNDEKSRKVITGSLVMVEDNEDSFISDKENLTTQVSRQVSRSLKTKEFPFSSCARIEKEIMNKRTERKPFQSLLEIPPSRTSNGDEETKSSMGTRVTIKDDLTAKCEPSRFFRQPMSEVLHKPAEERTPWNIVVDASCFLDEESRRSLQLLEGIKGTHLIIPRIVIRELDCLKRRECFFSKSTKMASKALQWIEQCMKNTSWWIHAQSSFETIPVPPTPPISPQSPYGDSVEPKSFSTYGSLTEIVSPTAEDHILDSALLFKKIKTGAKFVILSNSITLKIKAMAEGLLCETPIEFRESLVNPFSKRFLWVDSSPRGSTWSCSNDTSQFNNSLHQQPLGKLGKVADCVKGLKLILLHNSQYAQITSVKK